MQKLPVICPSCEHTLSVSQLSCSRCATAISGDYLLPAFLRLTAEEQKFVMDFVISGGSLKTMASKLDKSYPTVRNMLDDLIEKLTDKNC